jgi:hypothetical protein
LSQKENTVNKGNTYANKSNEWLVPLFCLALFCALAIPRAVLADEWDQATKLTFSESVEVPGQALPAGTYWFRLADSDSDRSIVQIWNSDRTQLVTTILAIPDYRQTTSDKTIINFAERPVGQPEAIQSWFYPGNRVGEEFVYPKTRAKQLAKQTGRPVLSMPDERASNAAQIKQVSVKTVSPSGEEIALQKSPPAK